MKEPKTCWTCKFRQLYKDIKEKVKNWFNENIIAATEKALKILRGEIQSC